MDRESDTRPAYSGDRPIRSFAKALSWRVTGSLDTTLLSWLFTGDVAIAAAIGLTEVLTKTVLYYLHERAWNRVPLGRGGRAVTPVASAGVALGTLGAPMERRL